MFYIVQVPLYQVDTQDQQTGSQHKGPEPLKLGSVGRVKHAYGMAFKRIW